MVSSSPKAPKKTQQEKNLEVRQQTQLNKEIEESEERFAALARNQLGNRSLLSGAATTVAQAASGGQRGGSRGGGSLLGGTGGGGGVPSGSILGRVTAVTGGVKTSGFK